MSGPYRVVPHSASPLDERWSVREPGGTILVTFPSSLLAEHWCDKLNAAYAAGLAARGGREAELPSVPAEDDMRYSADVIAKLTDELIGGYERQRLGSLPRWAKSLIHGLIQRIANLREARALLTPTEDREYQIAVEKLMKEPG